MAAIQLLTAVSAFGFPLDPPLDPALPFMVAAAEPRPPGAMEAIHIATEAYIYGYPLVTFDMARKQQTNVPTPDAEHAPMG